MHKNQISPLRKILYGIMFLVVFLCAFGAGNLSTALALDEIPETPTEILTPTPTPLRNNVEDQISALSVSPTIYRYWPNTENYSVNVGTTIQFSIEATDADGDLKAADWYLQVSNVSTPKFWDPWSGRPKYSATSLWSNTFNQPGEFYVFVYVNDDANNKPFIWWKITVTNQKPTISLVSPPTPVDGTTISNVNVTFKWQGSDSDGTVQGYTYEIDGTGYSTGSTSVTINLSAGSHTFRVSCFDNNGTSSDWASTAFTITPPPPDLKAAIQLATQPPTGQPYLVWGQYAAFNLSVVNEGGVASGNYKVDLIASNDSIIGDSDDWLMNSWNVSSLSSGSQWGQTYGTNLPFSPYAGMPSSGTVYYGLHAYVVSGETDTTDNQPYFATQMELGKPLPPGSSFPTENFKDSTSVIFTLNPAPPSVLNVNNVPGANNSWAAMLVLPPYIAASPSATGVPHLKSNLGYKYGTYEARVKTAVCDPDNESNVGVISGFFTFFNDRTNANNNTLPDNSEIDFEWFCAEPHIVYLSMWTDYDAKTESLSKVTRIINLRDGTIIGTCYQTAFGECKGENLSGTEAMPVDSDIEPIPGYNSSAAFYDYGFEWQPTGVRWWIVVNGNPKTLGIINLPPIELIV